ncbi:MAG: hypothetical protein JXO51_09600 [Candidatus Aminicenantes bacterium]|nr:hypothetical protein [Candidatus Aminicenantes bacterium]
MKKGFVGLFAMLLAVVLVSGLMASSAEDYKVIKNAVQNPEKAKGVKGVQWFKILVTGKGQGGEKVKITLPVSLVEIMLDACPDKEFRIDGDCRIDLQRIWKELKAAGPLALVEVENHGEIVKIWLE